MRLKDIFVLLVEDDDDNLDLLRSCLEEEGATTYCAGSIADALAATSGKPLNVVVSDLELEDGDGCVLLSKLAARETVRRLPAIAITGYSEQSRREQALECGFARYAVKPFPFEELVRWIAELTGSSGASGAGVES
jgi:CheY-like chemotaxis protein